jgi:spermidine/putrescine transport system permease protein
MSLVRRHRFLQGALLFGPAAVWALIFVVVPTGFAICMSLWRFDTFHLVHEWNLDSYKAFFQEGIYHDPLWTSLKYGFAASAISVALSLPLAHYIHFRAKRRKTLLFGAVVIALWLGYLLRIFGWRILLGQQGVINSLLMDVGVIDHPLGFLLYSPFAVVVSQAHLAMPFAFIPIYAAMERLPNGLMQAASDLGASRWRQIVNVELPLISNGLIFGALFAFVLAFGDYFAPTLVGPPSDVAIGSIAGDQFGGALNWPQGAAIGAVMLVVVMLALLVPEMIRRIWRLVGRIQERSDNRKAAV